MKYFLATASAAVLLTLMGCKDNTNSADPIQSTQSLIDYEAYTLDNGLDVILARDASDPIVAITTVIHAGSNREKPGRTGFAHFFEHMAFNDSENVPVGANRRDIPAWGGSRNGGTWSDGTYYYETVPKDAFDKLLWIDSDRLGYMINTVTTAALEREKQVVKNEKRQRVDNAPYGYTQEVIRRALYPEGHPYSWTVIGSLPDLQAATLEDLKEFHTQYYGAGNVTLAIVGDIDIEETKTKVEYWFGEIDSGPDVAKPVPRPVTLDASKRLMFEDNFAKLPELRLTYPVPQALSESEVALDVLADILGGSKSSPLYKHIVEDEGLAPGVTTYLNAMEMAGEFVIRVRAEAGTDLDDVIAAVDNAMAQFAVDGVDPNELARIKANQETSLYNEISTVLGKSQSLAINNEFAGDPEYGLRQADAIRAVTSEDVIAAFDEWIVGKPRIITSFVPKGQLDLAVDGSDIAEVWIEEVRDDVASENVSQGEEAVYERTQTVADRSEPEFGELPLSTTFPIYKATLPGGAELTGTQSSETPLVEFYINFTGGSRLDADEKAGVSSLLTAILNDGSALHTPAEIDRATGLLGSSTGIGATDDQIFVNGQTLKRNLKPTLEILQEVLTQPRFTEDNLEQNRDAALTRIRDGQANPGTIAVQTFNRLVYGDHPDGRPSLGTEATVGALSMEDLKARFANMGAHGITIQIAGDLNKDEAIDAFTPFIEAFDVTRSDMPALSLTPPDLGGKVYFIDVPGSKQSVIRAGRMTVSSLNPELQRIDFTNEKLGGSIGADLAQTLRIEKGYTYGAYSGVGGGTVAQPWSVRTSVRANATGPSLDIIRDMVGDHAGTFTAETAEQSRNKIIKDTAREQESLGAKLNILFSKALYGRSDTLIEERQERLLAMTVEDFQETADKWFDPADMVWVIVGDGETQRDVVKAFAATLPGGTFEELDSFGEPIAN